MKRALSVSDLGIELLDKEMLVVSMPLTASAPMPDVELENIVAKSARESGMEQCFAPRNA